ncbi:porin family protein [Ferruginibacter albus]|uniref:porin family protein n=1 Tax=Ferruginibacter albus TaxID=2875540 RepID=UPI001CC500B4|nr:porin family protein [Ferruginibacter albus]UAY53336.1 PorT family protein [Ferruginibacter albus]
MKTILFLITAMLTQQMFAQPVEPATETSTTTLNPGGFYVRGGVNFSNISVNNNGSVNNANTLTTFNVGFLADLPLGDVLSFQTGLYLNGQGAQAESFADKNNTSDNYVKSKLNPWYLQVPANIVFKFPIVGDSRFFIGVGPYAQMGVFGKTTVETKLAGNVTTRSADIKFNNDDLTTSEQEDAGFDKLKRFDFGLNALAGIETEHFLFGVNYGWGFTKINSTQSDNSENDNNKYRSFSINLGFKL